MKWAALIAVLCLPLSSKDDEFRANAIRMELAWNPFIRRLFGCPDVGEISKEVCKSSKAYIDRKNYESARESAKRLFSLKD